MLVVLGIILVAVENLVAGQQFNNSTEFPAHTNATQEPTDCLEFPTETLGNFKPAVIGATLGCLLLVIIIIGIVLARRRSRRPRAAHWSTRSMMYSETVSPSFVATLRESMNASVRSPTGIKSSTRPPDSTGLSDEITGVVILSTQSMTSYINDNDRLTSSVTSQLPSYDEVIRHSKKENDTLPPPYTTYQ